MALMFTPLCNGICRLAALAVECFSFDQFSQLSVPESNVWLAIPAVEYRLSRHFRPLRQLPVLHRLETSFNSRYLASRRFWYASCLCRRVQSRD
jgi:hypothetical protein